MIHYIVKKSYHAILIGLIRVTLINTKTEEKRSLKMFLADFKTQVLVLFPIYNQHIKLLNKVCFTQNAMAKN